MFRVFGRVQGVGFRYFAAQRARALQITGWVRNLSDGSVEILASGTDATLGAFRESLGQGPAFARVDEVSEGAAVVNDAGDAFEIRPTPNRSSGK